MGIDLSVGPLEGIDEPDADLSGPFFEHCLAVLDVANDHLAGLGLPPHDEPRSVGDLLGHSFKYGLSDLVSLDALLPDATAEGHFGQLWIAAPLCLYLPVDFPGTASFQVGGEPFRLGSAPRLLFQTAHALTLLGDHPYDLSEAEEQYGDSLGQPPEGWPVEVPATANGWKVGVEGCGPLYWAAVNAIALNASVYVH